MRVAASSPSLASRHVQHTWRSSRVVSAWGSARRASFWPAIVISRIATAFRPSAATHAFKERPIVRDRVQALKPRRRRRREGAVGRPRRADLSQHRRRAKSSEGAARRARAVSRIEGVLLTKSGTEARATDGQINRLDRRSSPRHNRCGSSSVRRRP